MEVEILHSVHGDKKRQIDTSTERGRQEAAVLLNKLLRTGVAIFLERGKKVFRVKSYNEKEDMLIVNTEIHGQSKDVKAKASKSKTTAVAPVAGGCTTPAPQQVVFVQASTWQKPECLFCNQPRVLEARYGISQIRCCEGEECKKRAASLAMAPYGRDLGVPTQ